MKTVLITGANRGIGLEHTRLFASKGIHVFATARKPAAADDLRELVLTHNGTIKLLEYDAANPSAPAQLKSALGDTPIDLLLANAGSMDGMNPSFDSVDVESVMALLRVNALAPLGLAQALADNVARSSRKLIAFQSSQMGSINDNSSGGYYAYRVSKAALNMIAKGASNDLRSRGITVVALHPGWVKTRMGGRGAPLTVAQSASGQQRVFDSLRLQDSGKFFNFDGKILPW